MKTIEINLYSYNELSDKAKQNAKNNFEYDDFWSHERLESMKAAKELYRLFDTDEEIKGIRLYKFIQNNILPKLRNRIKYINGGGKYPSAKIREGEKARFSKIQFNEDAIHLTGYCTDYNFLEPIFDFLKSPDKHTTSADLLNTSLEDIYDRDAQAEYEAFYEDQNFSEHCEANGYTFEENGRMRNY